MNRENTKPRNQPGKASEERQQLNNSSWRGHGSFAPAFWFVLLIAVLLFTLNQRNQDLARTEIPAWATFKQLLETDAIKPGSVTVKHDRIDAALSEEFVPDDALSIDKKAGQELPLFVAIDSENRQFFIEQLNDLEVAYHLDTSSIRWGSILLSWLPLLLLIAFLWFIMFRVRQTMSPGAGGMVGGFGKSQHRVVSKGTVNVTLDDIAGIDEAKAEISEVIEFLQNPARFEKIGARMPRGVLLLGPPGWPTKIRQRVPRDRHAEHCSR